jgi:serine/threonine protein kinase
MHVAIKKLAGSMLSSQVNDFFREASLMLSIPRHRNVVRIFGMCQEMNNFSLVMEFLPSGSLDGYIASLDRT